MLRFLVLAGYFELMMYLQVSGNLDQYINVHYRYLAILSMILSAVLALVQLRIWVKNDKTAHHHDDGHDHVILKPYQRGIAYVLLSLPIIIGLLFPTVSLDTTIVDAKGFNFPVSKESVGDPEMTTQYLKPDTSLYFSQSEYKKQMAKLMKKYESGNEINVTDANYLELMELIYNYPSQFSGKKISYTGFAYCTKQAGKVDTFLFRFGIIHCVADSGVFGLLLQLPAGTSAKNNEWLHVEGTIQTTYYAPFERQLPTVKVTSTASVAAPSNQYVYRNFN